MVECLTPPPHTPMGTHITTPQRPRRHHQRGSERAGEERLCIKKMSCGHDMAVRLLARLGPSTFHHGWGRDLGVSTRPRGTPEWILVGRHHTVLSGVATDSLSLLHREASRPHLGWSV